MRSVVIIVSLLPGLPSDTNVVTPNTEYSWDFTTKTRSTNDDGTSLDLEWEDEEGDTLIFAPILKFSLAELLIFMLSVAFNSSAAKLI